MATVGLSARAGESAGQGDYRQHANRDHECGEKPSQDVNPLIKDHPLTGSCHLFIYYQLRVSKTFKAFIFGPVRRELSHTPLD